ncbi:MAG: AAA family ATPase [Armatimonadetes bacterium]|nr:AAA family ATPase [Armatimonadota bacterium]
MRIAVAGKGGVGKTTVAAGLCLLLAEQGRSPWAVDADPNNCLGYALGFPQHLLDDVKPLSEMREMLAERAGSSPGQGGMFLLNPDVTDIISDYEINDRDISLLVMGIVDEGGTGCMCPENATLRTILRELVHAERDLIVDMVAGLEHLGRGTAQAVDGLLIITQPRRSALRTVPRIRKLAEDIGITHMWVLGNNVSSDEEADQIQQSIPQMPLLGTLGHYPQLQDDDVFAGASGSNLKSDLSQILTELEEQLNGDA